MRIDSQSASVFFFYHFTENNSFSSYIVKSLSIQITFILNARARYRNGKSKVRFPDDYIVVFGLS